MTGTGQKQESEGQTKGGPKEQAALPLEEACHDYIQLNGGSGTAHFHLCVVPVVQQAPYIHVGKRHECPCGFIWGHGE